MSVFRIVVPAGTCVVRYRHGAVVAVLPPGRHRRAWRGDDIRLDLRRTWIQVAPQEIPSSDGVPVKMSAAVQVSVSDPVAYLEITDDPRAGVYLATQVALREALAGLPAAELTQRRMALPGETVVHQVRSVAAAIGVDVHQIVVKDIMLPAEVRAAAMELATSRQRAAAQLEAARAETAALRAQANTAKLLDDHPALAQLKLLQALPFGAKVVLSVGGAAEPSE